MISEKAWAVVSKEPYSKWVPILERFMSQYNINTKERIAMFLAQASHESGGFSRLVENLNYSAEGLAKVWPSRYAEKGKPNALALSIARKPELIANHTYANRMGNSTPESGDGWKYRGRGIFQLTGKSNYDAFFKDTGVTATPDDLTNPTYAVLSACWFWNKNRLNAISDTKDVERCTRVINGGLVGLDHRKKLYSNIIKVL